MKGIITADIHFRDDTPICRTETPAEWKDFQIEVFEYILRSAKDLGCPVYIVGDFVEHPTISTALLNRILNRIYFWQVPVYFLIGNHDAPYHNLENVKNSTLGIITTLAQNKDEKYIHLLSFECDKQKEYDAFDFGTETESDKPIIFTHQLVFPNPEDCKHIPEAKTAEELIKEFPNAKYIFTGDYHRAFVHNGSGCNVINPGCTSVQNIDLIDYNPVIFHVDTEINKIDRLDLPNNQDSIDNSYILRTKDRDERIEKFISRVRKGSAISLDFEDNLKDTCEALKDKGVQEIIQEISYEIHKSK